MQQQVNKNLVKERFTTGLQTYAKEAVVQQAMAVQLAQAVEQQLKNRPLSVLEAGCGCGLLTAELLRALNISDYTANDLVPACETVIRKLATPNLQHKLHFLPGDIENLSLAANYDLITGNAVFQWLENPAGFWNRIADHLNAEGLIAITLFGAENFKEIATLTGRFLNYPTVEQLHDLFSPKFDILELYPTIHILHFSTGLEVLRHIRHTGTGGLAREHWGKNRLLEFEAAYQQQFATPAGLIPLTYQPIYLLARKKH